MDLEPLKMRMLCPAIRSGTIIRPTPGEAASYIRIPVFVLQRRVNLRTGTFILYACSLVSAGARGMPSVFAVPCLLI